MNNDTQALQIVNFEATKDTIYAHLNGSMTLLSETAEHNDPPTLDVSDTNLPTINDDVNGLVWISDLPIGVEQLFHNSTLSLIAIDFGMRADVPCQLTNVGLVFSYDSRKL